MAKFCEVCGKGPRSGNLVSHSHRKNKRVWNPNVQRVRVMDGLTPTTKYVVRPACVPERLPAGSPADAKGCPGRRDHRAALLLRLETSGPGMVQSPGKDGIDMRVEKLMLGAPEAITPFRYKQPALLQGHSSPGYRG